MNACGNLLHLLLRCQPFVKQKKIKIYFIDSTFSFSISLISINYLDFYNRKKYAIAMAMPRKNRNSPNANRTKIVLTT